MAPIQNMASSQTIQNMAPVQNMASSHTAFYPVNSLPFTGLPDDFSSGSQQYFSYAGSGSHSTVSYGSNACPKPSSSVPSIVGSSLASASLSSTMSTVFASTLPPKTSSPGEVAWVQTYVPLVAQSGKSCSTYEKHAEVSTTATYTSEEVSTTAAVADINQEVSTTAAVADINQEVSIAAGVDTNHREVASQIVEVSITAIDTSQEVSTPRIDVVDATEATDLDQEISTAAGIANIDQGDVGLGFVDTTDATDIDQEISIVAGVTNIDQGAVGINDVDDATDIMTKPLPAPAFQRHRNKLSVMSMISS
ncbi:hypothetical protein V6N12_068158 [Hibiscus sabdariffa]|uniref:Uncharacterized protein n=1 Tax=Hibiscus sabdariffa TaxID=183260 RepID=A0ABR2FPE8_9ROSI